jgi:hypothetical protein
MDPYRPCDGWLNSFGHSSSIPNTARTGWNWPSTSDHPENRPFSDRFWCLPWIWWTVFGETHQYQSCIDPYRPCDVWLDSLDGPFFFHHKHNQIAWIGPTQPTQKAWPFSDGFWCLPSIWWTVCTETYHRMVWELFVERGNNEKIICTQCFVWYSMWKVPMKR